jgi:hypothetical protein
MIRLFSLTLILSLSLQAANWLMLQGTEPTYVMKDGNRTLNTRKTPVLWGFIQANYIKDYGSLQNINGKNVTPFSLLAPNLQDQSGFNLARGRIGLRGMADDENLVNYFTLFAFENSGITNLFDTGDTTGETLVDASITLKHIPYAKLRVGQFKTPGSEEGLRATFASPYILFTDFTNQQIMERQSAQVGLPLTGAAAGGAQSVHYNGTPSSSVSAFRDKGAQVFDAIKLSSLPSWELSYAYMIGNGTGLQSSSSDNQLTHYGYLAMENYFGKGKGFFTESLKLFAWGQFGERELLVDDGSSGTRKERYDRNRYGLGMTYYQDGLRITSELMGAEGMIFAGAKDANIDPNLHDWQIQQAAEKENKAYGGYFNVQYEFVPKKWEVFGRYDQMNRLTNDEKGERIVKTLTLGTSYRFKGPTRIDFNYAIREGRAYGNANAQRVLDNAGNRLMIQLTAFFKN